jgi:hypothetical protein
LILFASDMLYGIANAPTPAIAKNTLHGAQTL